MLLALLTNNLGVLWIAMELATLSTVLLVSLYRTPTAIEAAWKYFILCGVGIALALFGTVLLYFAAERVLGKGGEALLWTNLNQVKDKLEPTVLSLAFVFLMVGYGTKVGLVPLHNWLEMQGSCRRSYRYTSGRLYYDGVRAFIYSRCSLFPFEAKGYKADVFVFIHRAYGHSNICIRPWRANSNIRRTFAHAGSQSCKVIHILYSRPCISDARNAGDG